MERGNWRLHVDTSAKQPFVEPQYKLTFSALTLLSKQF